MSSRLSPSPTSKVWRELSLSTKVTWRSWPGLGGVRSPWWWGVVVLKGWECGCRGSGWKVGLVPREDRSFGACIRDTKGPGDVFLRWVYRLHCSNLSRGGWLCRDMAPLRVAILRKAISVCLSAISIDATPPLRTSTTDQCFDQNLWTFGDDGDSAKAHSRISATATATLMMPYLQQETILSTYTRFRSRAATGYPYDRGHRRDGQQRPLPPALDLARAESTPALLRSTIDRTYTYRIAFAASSLR